MKNVLMVGDYKKSYGGISVQMEMLQTLFSHDKNISVDLFSTKSWYIFKPIVFVKLFFKAKQCDTIKVHGCSNFGFLTVVMAFICAKYWKKKIIVVYHGGGAKKFFEKHPHFLTFLRESDLVVVPSGYLYDIFKKFGIPTKIIYNSIDLKLFKFKKRTRLKPHLIITRNLKPIYNIECAIDAFQIVKRKYPDATLTIVGDGPLRKQLEESVLSKKLEGVVFKGQINNVQLPHELNKADIFLNTAIEDNMPVSVLEGFACGLGIVASNVGGIPYLIKEKKTGLLAKPNNPKDFAEKIDWLLTHQSNALQLINHAHTEVSRYSHTAIKKEWTKELTKS